MSMRRLVEEVNREAHLASLRRSEARMLSGQTTLDLIRPSPERVMRDGGRPAFSREPCRRCGARGDVGCKHQNAFEDWRK